jgi:hypothetical protein
VIPNKENPIEVGTNSELRCERDFKKKRDVRKTTMIWRICAGFVPGTSMKQQEK